MPRTKQTARQSTSLRAPRNQLLSPAVVAGANGRIVGIILIYNRVALFMQAFTGH